MSIAFLIPTAEQGKTAASLEMNGNTAHVVSQWNILQHLRREEILSYSTVWVSLGDTGLRETSRSGERQMALTPSMSNSVRKDSGGWRKGAGIG